MEAWALASALSRPAIAAATSCASAPSCFLGGGGPGLPGAASAAESAVGSGQEGPGDKVKMSRRLTARPSEQEVVSKLGPTSKMGRSLQETKHVPLLDFASSRSGAPPVAG